VSKAQLRAGFRRIRGRSPISVGPTIDGGTDDPADPAP
jgi:hypothetical protein